MLTSILPLTALIAGVTALAFWLDYRFRPFSRIGASLLSIIFGALLSNTGIVPPVSPVYDAVGGPVTSLAIAWLLLAVNLQDLRRAGTRMIAAFGLGLVGTVLGALAGAVLFAQRFGEDTWRLAGTLTGTYSGGSVNFVAVGRGVGLPDALFAGATAADNLTTALWLGATLMLPLWLGKRFAAAPVEAPEEEMAESPQHPFFAPAALSTLDLAILLAAGLALLVAAQTMTVFLPAVPAVLWLTTFALLAGHLTRLRKRHGSLQLGNLALHFFFVIIGIHSRIADIVAVGIEVFYFTAVVVGIHGLVVYGVGRLVGLDVASLSVASQAAVGGPSSALAVAVSREWRALVLPGVIMGLLGYALGNYLGFAVAFLVRGLGIGM